MSAAASEVAALAIAEACKSLLLAFDAMASQPAGGSPLFQSGVREGLEAASAIVRVIRDAALSEATDAALRSTAKSRGREPLVRYVSPFGSPAWMTRERAQALLADDDARYVEWSQLGLLSAAHRRIGPPRIEQAPR